MKKLLILLVGIVVLASCSNNRYAELVPADADMVVTFNAKDALEGCGTEGNMDEIIQEIEKISPISIPKSIKNVLKNPKELGLRLDKDAYYWCERAQERSGLVIRMHDEDDFKKNLKKIGSDLGYNVSFNKKDGYAVVEIEGGNNNNTIVTLNDDYLLIASSNKGDAENAVKSLANLDKDEQYIHSKRFARLDKADGQIKIDVSPSVVLSAKEWNLMKKGLQAESFDASPEELGCVITVSAKEGGIYARAEVYCQNEELNNKIQEAKKRACNIEGKLTPYVPKNYLCWMGANVNMPEMMKEESLQKAMDMVAENGLEVKNLLGTFNGDLQCFFTPTMKVIFNAEMGSEYNEDAIGTELSKFPQIKKKGMYEYAITQESYNWWTETTTAHEIAWMSVKDNMLTITDDKTYVATKCNDGNIFGDIEKEIKESVFALVVNKDGLKETDEQWADLIDYFASFYITINKDMQVKASLKFSKNCTLFELIKNMQKDGAFTRALVLGAQKSNKRNSRIDYNTSDDSATKGDFSYDDSEFDSWE